MNTHIWWSVNAVLGDKPKVADEPGPAVRWNPSGNLDPYAWPWWQWKELKRNTTGHAGHVVCSSKLPLHGRSISRRACAHMSPNWTRLWCIGAPALHLWAITEMHRQWWGKTPGGQTEQSERGGLRWPAFTLSCFRANCPTNRRAQTPPVAHHALQHEGGIYSPPV